MKIIIAKTAGFCMGVRRAVELVLDAPVKHQGPIHTFGPLIHNPQVLDLLTEKGISIMDEMPASGCGTVLIRAHGVPPQSKASLGKVGYQVVDATCPRVIKVQTIIKKHANRGYAVIIVGDADHPEVVGLLGYAGKRGQVVANLEQLQKLPELEKAIIVAQTTQNARLFADVVAWTRQHRSHYKIFETICDSTHKRQQEVRELAGKVDALVVVGGRASGNTQRLAEVARGTGKPTFLIESEDELDAARLGDVATIGITAGASTPHWIIKRVYRRLEHLLIKKQKSWRTRLYPIQRALLLTNTYVSLGAGCICYAALRLQQVEHSWPFVVIAILYVQSMHTLNHLTGRTEDQYNDPHRAGFYKRYEIPLALLALAAGAVCLLTAYTLGSLPFITLLLMSLMGLSYNLRLFPGALKLSRYRRIRDLPGSKTVLITVAWGIVTVVVPALCRPATWAATAIVMVAVMGLVFVRTAIFDILDVHGDRIVGKETIPLVLGETKTLRLLYRVLATVTGLLVAGALLQLISFMGILMAICPLYLFLVLHSYRESLVMPGVGFEFLVESHFIVAGLLAIFGHLFFG